jgi:glutamate synthase domain-containing protein 2
MSHPRSPVRYLPLLVVGLLAAACTVFGVTVSVWWWIPAVLLLALTARGVVDLVQRKHSILRNYPILGHARFLLEEVRPELQQYFIENNHDGRPYERDVRDTIYQRAKGIESEKPFGTERNVYGVGYEFLTPSMAPAKMPQDVARVRVGGPDCTQPYDMALLNVSAMSFGSLSSNAVEALNKGAMLGGFAHDTGEGGLSDHHLKHGGDIIWEIGTGYFGCRTPEGDFDPERFRNKAANPKVKAVLLKLSQGAKPGIGGVLPGEKVSAEVSRIRDVPEGETVISPPYHRVFSTPRELVLFMAQLRTLAGGKPVGFKLCLGPRSQFLAVCKAMVEEQVTPDFIVVDGSEGGTGAAPLEFTDTLGTPLTEGLMTVHNALVGAGLRDRIKIGASGKVATGADIVKRIAQGADFTNAARAMMFAIGCIQAQSCHTNTCPVGVATQDPKRARALDVPSKAVRVQRYQQATVHSARLIMASLGVTHPGELRPHMLHRRVAQGVVRSYAELYEWLDDKELLESPRQSWAQDWAKADPDSFRH